MDCADSRTVQRVTKVAPRFVAADVASPVTVKAGGTPNMLGQAREQLLIQEAMAFNARRACNLIKGLAPLHSAVLRNPSDTLDDATALIVLEQAAERLTERILAEQGLVSGQDAPVWLHRSVFVAVSKAIAEEWAVAREFSTAAEDRISAFYAIALKSRSLVVSQEYDQHPASAALSASLIHALMPVAAAFKENDMFRQFEPTAMHAASVLMSAVEHAASQVVDQGTSDDVSLFTKQSLLSVAGDLYASSWRRYCLHVANLADPDANALFDAHPDGLPLDEVDNMFQDTFHGVVHATTTTLSETINAEKLIEAKHHPRRLTGA